VVFAELALMEPDILIMVGVIDLLSSGEGKCVYRGRGGYVCWGYRKVMLVIMVEVVV